MSNKTLQLCIHVRKRHITSDMAYLFSMSMVYSVSLVQLRVVMLKCPVMPTAGHATTPSPRRRWPASGSWCRDSLDWG